MWMLCMRAMHAFHFVERNFCIIRYWISSGKFSSFFPPDVFQYLWSNFKWLGFEQMWNAYKLCNAITHILSNCHHMHKYVSCARVCICSYCMISNFNLRLFFSIYSFLFLSFGRGHHSHFAPRNLILHFSLLDYFFFGSYAIWRSI